MAKATGLASIAEGRSDMLRIDPRKLKIKPGFNSRNFDNPENQDHVQTLKASIKANGVKKPLTVVWEDKEAYITDGECRLRACMEAIKEGTDIKTVPVITEDRYANEADRVFTQIISNSGKAFTPLEKAVAYKKLLDLGWKANVIAEKEGVSPARVSQVLDLLTMPEPVKALVTAGTVSASMAASTVKAAQGDGAAATATLQAAASQAASEGSAKVLPRHTGQPRSNKMAEIRDIFNGCHIDLGNAEEGIVVIRMSANDYAKLKDMVPGIDD